MQESGHRGKRSEREEAWKSVCSVGRAWAPLDRAQKKERMWADDFIHGSQLRRICMHAYEIHTHEPVIK